jgi:hypothetical protein
MSPLIVFPLVLSLLLYLLPALLFRRSSYRFSREYLVSTSGTSDGVFQNSSLAYALQLSTFGPFFAWGVAGDWIPGVLNSIFFGFGLFFLYLGRHRIAAFVRDALASDQSITIHEFLAKSHGESAWIRVVASSLTIVALWGIVMAEMFGIATVLAPVLGTGPGATYLVVIGLFLLMFLYSTTGGNDGVMRTDQLQLGFAYLGLWGAVVGMLVLIGYSPTSRTAAGAVPVLYLGLFGIAWLLFRRGRFLSIGRQSSENGRGVPAAWRAYLTIEKVINVLVVVAVAAMIAFTVRYVVSAGPSSIGRSAMTSVTLSTGMSTLALAALAILPLLYQIVDITNWQRFAAVGELGKQVGPGRKALLIYAVEAPLVWIALIAFGGLAAATFAQLKEAANPSSEYITLLTSGGTALMSATAAAFLVAAFAIGLSTMDAVFSATQCAFQYDMLPGFVSVGRGAWTTQRKVRATRIFALVTYFAIILLFYFAEKRLTFGRDNYLALLIAFYSAQLAFVPLVGGAFVAYRRGLPRSPVSAGTAVVALVAGAIAGIGATVTALVRGPSDLLLWGSIPACLIVSTLIYVFGWYRALAQLPTIDPQVAPARTSS